MHPSVRSAVGIAAAVALLAPSQAFAGDHPSPGARAHVLTRSGHGASVVKALGDNLPVAAATNRMSASQLAEIVESDPTAWIGPDGQLFYKEAPDTPAEAAAMTAASGATAAAAAAYPDSQTFALHSNPASTHTIFLDFDGATVSGTWWNAYQGMDSRFYTGFTLDGDPSTFTSAELAYIQQVWQIVSEKYSPFDVDVTTQDPGPAGYDRNGSTDTTYGDHVIISNDSGALSKACGGGCSGVALVGTFNDTWRTDDYLEPAWVFSSQTSGSAVLTAHTVAHEVGHTLGLQHDGDATHEYYGGQGNWFPIMGSSARAVGQFSMGEYTGAKTTQANPDDLAVIAEHGAPVRADDRGNTTTTASPLTAGTLVDGVISTRADQDVFAVSHDCATNLTARATGIGAGASLDMSVTVLNAAGTPIASADPASGQNTAVWPALPTGMDASVTVPAAPSGVYYVRVDGVGRGNPATDGYSDYGSIGTYQLAVSACDGTMPPPTSSVTTAPAGTGSTASTANVPWAPGIGAASSGRRGNPVTATARWTPPGSNGGAAIIGYRVRAELLGSSGRVLKVHDSRMVSAGSRALTMRLAKGRYRFEIVAYNAAGTSPYSAPSRVVVAR